MFKRIISIIHIASFTVAAAVFFVSPARAVDLILIPGEPVTTCGEMAAPGVYTLASDITDSSDEPCFRVSSDGVIIDGAGYTLSGTADWAIDARMYNGTSTLLNGANAATNLTINNLTITGFDGGIIADGNSDTDGNGVNGGYAGNGGDLHIYYSNIGNISSQGATSTTKSYGGVGGNVQIVADSLNLSNTNINLTGGKGSAQLPNASGGLAVNYSGTLTKTNFTVSPLLYLTVNNIELSANYPGGTWPLTPGTISECGTLLGSGTYTLATDIGSTESPVAGTCFIIASNDVTIDGAGYSIVSTTTNTSFAVEAGSFGNFTLGTTSVSGFTNLISSASSTTIAGGDVDLSDKYVKAGSLAIFHNGLLKYENFQFSSLGDFALNGVSYGAMSTGTAPLAPGIKWTANETNRSWKSIAASADGTKLAAVVANGQIYTSTDSGVTWTARDSSRNWYSITSSSDGTKLAAVVANGQIYTSTDSGVTWTPRESSRDWRSITSSADGTKLAAAVYGGKIYTSTDSGATWTPRESLRNWQSITSSADGTKLAAVVSNGNIYTSTDSGATWTARESSRYWGSVTSSADGTKLAAVVGSGQIYTSTDSGVTWTAHESSRYWQSITSSADGTKLAAVVANGQIYTSTDSGVTWTPRESSRNWYSITSSSDGTKLAAAAYNGKIYTSAQVLSSLSVDIVSPSTNTSTWNPVVSWGTAVTCQYSWDNSTWNTVDCANNGSDIPNPGYGSHTLYVKGDDLVTTADTVSQAFQLLLPISVFSPVGTVDQWQPSIDWDPTTAGNISNCYYSYDGFVSTSTANCSLNGSDIVKPSSGGLNTLSLYVTNTSGEVGYLEVPFYYSYVFVESNSSTYGTAVASSVDGKKVVVVGYYNKIYTSTDSGVTWTAHESSRYWQSITSSADGTKLAAVVANGQIYTSTDSGVTWTPRESSRDWRSITSSADGTKLAAVVANGQIYTSTDSGVTWMPRESSRAWMSITSSADGTKLAAVVYNGQIYTSTDSGVTWTPRESSRSWRSITSSADGTKLAAVVANGQIYTSTDSGVTWTPRESSRSWRSITSSADGTKLAAAVYGGKIYVSIDSGVSWTTVGDSRSWLAITTSASGNKFWATVEYGKTYSFLDPFASLSLDILSPLSNTNTWNPVVSWGTAVSCQYSWDNSTWNTLDCANNGADIPNPGYGAHTLYVKGDDSEANSVSTSVSFGFPFAFTISSPVADSTVNSWNPVVNWDIYDDAVTNCQYSYNNFVSTTSVNCALQGTDILPPSANGTSTLSLMAQVGSAVATSSVRFNFVQSGWIPRESEQLWSSITSSSDGTKLAAVVSGGQIYTSTDSGVNWTARESSRSWKSITSSADGTKLAAVVTNGKIYTSTDSGVTWTPRESSRAWMSITSSADGTKLAAVVQNGQIYTSTDSGVTWTPRDSSRAWVSITSSSDGTKLAAVVGGGQIYTSTTTGATWTARNSSRFWQSITSSSDGTKLAAVVSGGQIYTSTDSGVNWTARDSSRDWRSITSSADGTKLAAAVYQGQIYTSTNSGVSWTAYGGPIRNWKSIVSSGDGSKLAAVTVSGPIYTFNAEVNLIQIIRPTLNAVVGSNQWNPLINWGDSQTCMYSYNNFVSTSTANCLLAGNDITTPTSNGTTTLKVRGINGSGAQKEESVTFNYSLWVAGGTAQSARFTMGGKKLAVVKDNVIYISSDAGVSWDSYITISSSNALQDAVISPDGSKMVAIESGWGRIMTSNDSGITWTAATTTSGELYLYWNRIAASLDGKKLATIGLDNSNKVSLYVSDDYGQTWVQRESVKGRLWNNLVMSYNGDKMIVFDYSDNTFYSSEDFGLSWNATGGSVPTSISYLDSSADGTKLVGAINGGQIYTSTDSGATWTAREASRNWYGVTSSADGTKLAAVVYGGQIYKSVDSGITWSAEDTTRYWQSVTTSVDGTKFAAVTDSYQLYYSVLPSSLFVSAQGTPHVFVEWSPFVYWGESTTCEYSWDNSTWNSVNCSNDGADIPSPQFGTSTLYIRGSQGSNTALDQIALEYGLQVQIVNPTGGYVSAWDPEVRWDPSNAGNIITCEYSYDNWQTSQVVNCANNGSDIPAPVSEGEVILSVRVVDSNNNTGSTKVVFRLGLSQLETLSVNKIASSADGKRLIALLSDGGFIQSTDAGNTWSAETYYGTYYSDVSMSSDGKYITIVSGGLLMVSSDYGATWDQKEEWAYRNWLHVDVSASGKTMIISSDEYDGDWNARGVVFVSNDYGNTWQNTPLGFGAWYAVSVSDNGKMIAASNGLWSSSDYGSTWNHVSDLMPIMDLDMSSDGTKIIGIDGWSSYAAYVSTDSGSTWNNAGIGDEFRGAKISADGSTLIVAGIAGVQYSLDSGSTWNSLAVTTGKTWADVASSADGNNLYLVSGGDGPYVWKYSLSGNFTISSFSPQEGSDISSWDPFIAWGMSQTCQYSWNNVNWQNVDCVNGGSDIARPAYGSKTLYLKGARGAETVTAQVSFTYSPRIISPQEGVPLAWSPEIDWDVNDSGNIVSCSYSYDNFVSSTTVNCALGGSDILPPTSVPAVLKVKAIDSQNNQGIASVSLSSSLWSSHLPGSNMYGIAVSANGKIIYAGEDLISDEYGNTSGGGLYKSTDSGTNWTQIGSMGGRWQSVSSSADGSIIFAANSSSGNLLRSIDGGQNFDFVADNSCWNDVKVSYNGKKLVAIDCSAGVWVSEDMGNTWAQSNSGSGSGFSSISMSADGKKVAAIANVYDENSGSYVGSVWISNDGGLNWEQFGLGKTWNSVAVSADGSKILAGSADVSTEFYDEFGNPLPAGVLWLSVDGGVNWSESMNGYLWSRVVMSADGSKMYAVEYAGPNGSIRVSNDSGQNWSTMVATDGRLFGAAAVSSNGLTLSIADGYLSKLWMYNEYASAPTIDILSPVNSETLTSWSPFVSWGSASVCQYSWDSAGWETVNCGSNGSDILAPTESGAHTLHLKALRGSAETTKDLQVTYVFLYWCGTADSDWSNGSNWHTSASCSAESVFGSSPDGETNAVLVGNTSPLVADGWVEPKSIDSTGLTGEAQNAGVIFTGNTVNIGTIIGNATFRDNSQNSAPITGNVIFEGYSSNNNSIDGNVTLNGSSFISSTDSAISGNLTLNTDWYSGSIPTTSTLTLSGSRYLVGSVAGTIYASDGSTAVNDFVFTGSSRNQTIITGSPTFSNSAYNLGTIYGSPTFANSAYNAGQIVGITTTFSDGAYNAGTITGSVIFNDTLPFRIGTVVGTTTLVGANQTLTGTGSTTVLIKNASVRDTLYLTSGTTLTVSNALTLRGVDADNLFTVKSTVPNSYASINIPSSANMDFLRIKDIHNIGTNLSLVDKVAYNDGGNSGFTFSSTPRGSTINTSADNSGPTAHMSGASTIVITKGTSWTDPGVTWTDASGVVGKTKSGTVNTNVSGDYTITYRATDTYGNSSVTYRTVIVNAYPVASLIGSESVSISLYSNWSDPGFNSSDPDDTSLTRTITGSVNTNFVGSYTITYKVTDPHGLSASVTRTVRVYTPTVRSSRISSGSGGGLPTVNITPKYVAPLTLKDLPLFGLPATTTLGVTQLPNPLTNINTPKNLKLATTTTFSFTSALGGFLFDPLPKEIVDLSKSLGSVKRGLAERNITVGHDLIKLLTNPIPLPTLATIQAAKITVPDSLVFVSSQKIPLQTSLSVDITEKPLQIITIKPNTQLELTVRSSDPKLTGTFQNKSLAFTTSGVFKKTLLYAPERAGRYTITIGTRRLEIRVEVPVPVQPKPPEKKSLWGWVTKLF